MKTIWARTVVLVLLCAGFFICCTACLGSIDVNVDSRNSMLVLTMRDETGNGVLLETSNKAGVRFALPDGTVDQLATVKQVEDDGTQYRFLTASGREVLVSIKTANRNARISITPVDWKAEQLAIDFPIEGDEDFFGGGEVWNGSVCQNGKKINLWVKNGTPDECCYVPFFFSTRGYGLFFDTSEHGVFSFGADDPKAVTVCFSTRDRQGISFYFIGGPEPKDVIKNYAAISGLPPLPPKWNFLPWKWRDVYDDWDQVFEDAEGMRWNNIPCSVIWIDNPWQKFGLCSFEFDPKRFPDAEKHVSRLKSMGYKLMLWVAPFTNPEVPNYETALAKGYFIKDPKGKPYKMGGGYYIDLTNPEAYKWWKEELVKAIKAGADGFKLDRAQDIPRDAVFFNGATGASMHNEYARLYCKVCYEALSEIKGSDFTMLPRPGSAGSQVYSPGKWPGDLASDFSADKGLGSAITAGLSIGLAAFPYWGSDIGGFERGGPDIKLLARWTEFGCFSPIMELGGQDPHEPWLPLFGPGMLKMYRYYATLHTELLPYTYTYAITAASTGLPIMRPLVIGYSKDKTARRQSYEFTYGDSILVAPIYTENNERDIYLPEGEWIDYWNWNNVFAGPINLKQVHYPVGNAPVFLKNGAIIPMEVTNDITGHGGTYSKGKLTVLVLPSGKSEFTLLDAVDQNKDVVKKTMFKASRNGSKAYVTWQDATQPLLLRVRMKNVQKVVSSTGKAYSKVTTQDYTGVPGTWAEDSDAGCVLVSPRTEDSGVVLVQ